MVHDYRLVTILLLLTFHPRIQSKSYASSPFGISNPFLSSSKLSRLGIPSLARIRRSELGSYAVPVGIHIGNVLPCGYYSAGDQEEDAEEGASHQCDHAPTTHRACHIHRTWAQRYKLDTKVLPAVRNISLNACTRSSHESINSIPRILGWSGGLFPLLLCVPVRLAYTAGLIAFMECRHSTTNDTLKFLPLLKPFTQTFR